MRIFHTSMKRLFSATPVAMMAAIWIVLNPVEAYPCGLTITENTKLTSDLLGCVDDGIIIAEDGVVLDLDGHSIIGVRNEFTAGIRVDGVKDVTIKNGTISSFERGIYLTNTANVDISELEIAANRYEGLLAYRSNGVQVNNNVIMHNGRSAIWVFDSDAELVGNLGQDNPSRTFYLSGGRVSMSGNIARGGAVYSAFTFANGYTASDYTLQDNLAEDIDGVGYLFAWGFSGSVTDGLGNSAVNTGGVECWTEEEVDCPLDLDSASTAVICGNDVCEVGESVCSCSADCGMPPLEICNDGTDNDCDGDVDCDDANCALDEICYVPPEPVPTDCIEPGEACSSDRDCCTGDCRINAKGRMNGTCH